MPEEKEFVGISQTTRAHLVYSLRESVGPMFSGDKDKGIVRFNKSGINTLDKFNYSTFTGWAGEKHCKELNESEAYKLKRYLVNYFLCPDATTEEELMACYYEVWPPAEIEYIVPIQADPQRWLNWGMVLGYVLRDVVTIQESRAVESARWR